MFMISLVTKSTGTLVKKLITLKFINFALFENFCPLILLIILKVEDGKCLFGIQGLTKDSSYLAGLCSMVLIMKVTGLKGKLVL